MEKKLYMLQYYILVPLSSFLNLIYPLFHPPIITEKIILPHPFFETFQKLHRPLMKNGDSNKSNVSITNKRMIRFVTRNLIICRNLYQHGKSFHYQLLEMFTSFYLIFKCVLSRKGIAVLYFEFLKKNELY